MTQTKPPYTLIHADIAAQVNSWGAAERWLQVELYQNDEDALLIMVSKRNPDDTTQLIASREFADGEMRQSDAERWLNDAIGYPNPFYLGELLA